MKPVTLEKEEAFERKRDLSRKLTVIARHLRNRFDQSVTKLGVTRSQWTLIAVVSSRPGLTQRTIAEILEISEAAAGRLIDRLCAEGLLERKARSDDRRAYSVYVTDAAAPYLETLSGIARRNEDETFSGLTEAQLGQLEDLLSLVYTNVAAQRDPIAATPKPNA
ncbi:MAG TPA: MarR family transcriptional regulator [Sphingobium sp.]|uniref:MarR family winged helix-turn-helix transcriptional regulator n=1 Tax=Sphingobium sp. TaxID=1912891 RepID=UPI002ED114ED